MYSWMCAYHQFLRGIIELRAQVQCAPLEVEELLVLGYSSSGSGRVCVESRVRDVGWWLGRAASRDARLAVLRAPGPTWPTLLGAIVVGGLGVVVLRRGVPVVRRGRARGGASGVKAC